MPSRKLKERQFYCLVDRKVITIPADDICFKNIKNSKMPNGKSPALIAYCEKYDYNMVKFVSHSKADSLKDKYGVCR